MDGLKYQMMKNISVVFLSLYSILLIAGAYNRLNTFVKHKKKRIRIIRYNVFLLLHLKNPGKNPQKPISVC